MFSSILRAGAAAAGIDSPKHESRERKVARLAVDVCQRMKAIEAENKRKNETCLGLYGNFFLSILGLFESTARFGVHLLIVLLFFFGYYIILCLSCGKAESGDAMRHQMSRVSLYSGLMMAMLGNILIPWKPTLYLFHTPAVLSRPNVPYMMEERGLPSSLDVENMCIDACCCCCNSCGCKKGHCACCGVVYESSLPPYKLAQSALFVVGCFSGCGCYQCTGGSALISRVDKLNEEVYKESATATSQFYQSQYKVASWEALVQSRLGSSPQPSAPQPNAPRAPTQQNMRQGQQQYAQVPQPPIAVAQPIYK